MVWLAVVPAIGIICLPLVMLLIVMTGSEYIGIVSASMAGVIVLGTVLLYTALISKDLARQTHRILGSSRRTRTTSPRQPCSGYSLFLN